MRKNAAAPRPWLSWIGQRRFFFSNVSHELRTPLTLMLGPLEELQARVAPEGATPNASEYEQLDLVHRNGLRLLKLVNALLDFSRIEAGRMEASYEATDLAAFTADLVSLFRSSAEKAGLQIICSCPTLPEPVYVDRSMWEKIVLNLLSNAIKHTFKGEIEVALRWCENQVELSVRDTGVGIPENQLEHVFDRFHRVQNVRSRTHEGTGIGLALVRELARMHGGDVRVTSQPDIGSTFTVSIRTGVAHLQADHVCSAPTPHAQAIKAEYFVDEISRWDSATQQERPRDDPAMLNPARGPEPGAGQRILFADDNADMRGYVVRLLREQGYAVDVVNDGEAALAAIQESRPDLVLTDIMMPRLDGVGLLRALRDDAKTSTLPIILLSARAGEEARIDGLSQGADDYLIKPFTARELLARVKACLEIANFRSQAEAQLRLEESERDFRALAETMPQIVWATRPDGWTVYFNHQWCEYTGLTLEESYGHGWNTPFHPDDRQRSWDAWQKAVHDNGTYALECRLRRADGAYRWWLVRGMPAFDAEGKLYKWFGTCTDIHDIKTAQEELTRLEERHRFALEALNAGEWLLDLETLNIERSERHDLIFGYGHPPAEWSYPVFLDHVLPEDRPEVDQLFQNAIAEQGVWQIDCRIRRHDSEIRWIHLCGEPRPGSNAQRQWVGVVLDITDQRNDEAALRQSAQRLRLATEGAQVGTWFWDIPGKSIDWSPTAREHLSLSPDAPGGYEEFLAVLHPDDVEHTNYLVQRSLREHQFFNTEYRVKRLEGSGYRWVKAAGQGLYDDAGQPLAMMGISQDNTERHEFETQISNLNAELAEKVEHLNSANAAKTQFLAHMSHELRTPLNAIMGFGQLLALETTSSEQQGMVEAINQAGGDLLRIINDLLDLTKMEAGQLVLIDEPFQLENLLDQIRILLRSSATEKGLALHIQDFGNQLGVLSGDDKHLKQVLVNLLGNAIKFTERGEVSLTVQQLHTDDPAIWLRFEIRDTGIGMSPDIITRIFQPFTQGDPSINRRYGGTGLGLVISKRIVEAMSGRMGVSSEPGQGSLFWFEVPFNKSQRKSTAFDQAPATLTSRSLEGLRILSVDDNPANLKMIEQVLLHLGAKVTAVESGQAALELLNAAPLDYDVVLMDVQMPGLDGLSTTQEIRKNKLFSALPVIALTAGVTQAECQAALGAGMNNFLSKPVDLRQVYTVLSGYLSKTIQ